LLHGFALSGEINWIMPGAVDSLAQDFMVVVPDLRGHGRSDKPRDVASYGQRFVEDIVGILDRLEIPKAHVAGYSMGGHILLHLLATHPERVHSAVLGGAGWVEPGSPLPPHAAVWLASLDRAARDKTSVAEALLPGATASMPPPLVEQLDRNDAAALASVLRSVPVLYVPEAQVRALKIPMHAVVGETDPVRAAVGALVRALPAVKVTIIPAADHAQAMGHPALASAIRAFALAN
jgi:pimeloyl-ACP methyl ester carboxylesterase